MQKQLSEYSNILFLLLIFMVFGILSSSFLSIPNLRNILIQSSSLIIIATGMTFVLLTAGIDLSVGTVMFISAIVSAKIILQTDSFLLALLGCLVVGVSYGLLNAIFIARFKIIPFIVTLATFYLGRGFGLMLSETRATNLPESMLKLGSATILGIPSPIFCMTIIVIFAHITLKYTTLGRQIYALGNDADKSKKAGISNSKILVMTYIICGFCAAFGGMVATAQLGAVSPTFGLQSEFMAIAAAVLGGTSLFGGKGQIFPNTVIGAVSIQTLQNGLVIINADPYIYPIVTAIVLFLIVLIDSLKNKKKMAF